MDVLVAGLHTLCDAKMVDHAVDRGFFDCTNAVVCLYIYNKLVNLNIKVPL